MLTLKIKRIAIFGSILLGLSSLAVADQIKPSAEDAKNKNIISTLNRTETTIDQHCLSKNSSSLLVAQREPNCCGQCTSRSTGKPGCLVERGGTQYCSSCN